MQRQDVLGHGVEESAVMLNTVTAAVAACSDEEDLVGGRVVKVGRDGDELKPDDITFIGVLSACAQAGLLKQATAPALVPFLYILVSDYSQRKHGAFIEKIPDNVDAVMLGALLATCRKCKNVEVGERDQAAGTLKLVELCGVVQGSDGLDESARMRGLTRESGVSKTPDCSWVVVIGKGMNHSIVQKVYQVLDLLVDEMRLEGYVPNAHVRRSIANKAFAIVPSEHIPVLTQCIMLNQISISTLYKLFNGSMEGRQSGWEGEFSSSSPARSSDAPPSVSWTKALMYTAAATGTLRKRAATVPTTKPAVQTPENTPKATARRDWGTLSATSIPNGRMDAVAGSMSNALRPYLSDRLPTIGVATRAPSPMAREHSSRPGHRASIVTSVIAGATMKMPKK
uniref:Uncharacterized protein n=1 Tax=Leersia perrieri TaxID=77586 RepID=A0A0D9WEZ9_9ORYZ